MFSAIGWKYSWIKVSFITDVHIHKQPFMVLFYALSKGSVSLKLNPKSFRDTQFSLFDSWEGKVIEAPLFDRNLMKIFFTCSFLFCYLTKYDLLCYSRLKGGYRHHARHTFHIPTSDRKWTVLDTACII